MQESAAHEEVSVAFGGERLVLLPDRAIWLPDHQALIVSDLHLGKISHFRKHGLAIPQSAELPDLLRLSGMCERLRPEHLILLGDLFHSDLNQAWESFSAWAAGFGGRITLVQGNHDILPAEVYAACGIISVPELGLEQLLLTHDPIVPPEGRFNLAGHVHPGVRLQGRGKQSLRLPCFFIRPNSLMVPAFGSFTGLHIPTPKEEDQIFAIVEGRVIRVL